MFSHIVRTIQPNIDYPMLRIRGDILLYHQHLLLVSGGHKVQPTFEPSSINLHISAFWPTNMPKPSPSEAIECRVENFSTGHGDRAYAQLVIYYRRSRRYAWKNPKTVGLLSQWAP
ncbi:hypothetical protein H0G86_002437 [Trichoderma simmonsii]|uniref:Uncharacterized protein n=1 Tax=Trichoderma simmonsii TaxID=1491479 RepID=A0A8G0L3H4_9HYPO|nr:hypothetical protein H0G86_002437 [Trichoderma simmonsii]